MNYEYLSNIFWFYDLHNQIVCNKININAKGWQILIRENLYEVANRMRNKNKQKKKPANELREGWMND